MALSSVKHLTPVPSCSHSCFLDLPDVKSGLGELGTGLQRMFNSSQSGVCSIATGVPSSLNLDTVLKLGGSLKSPLGKRYQLEAMFQEGHSGTRWHLTQSRVRHWVPAAFPAQCPNICAGESVGPGSMRMDGGSSEHLLISYLSVLL